jgi:hypothetical protein
MYLARRHTRYSWKKSAATSVARSHHRPARRPHRRHDIKDDAEVAKQLSHIETQLTA